MKKIAFFLAALLTSTAFAADAISLRFDAVPVAQFAKAIFGDILKKPYLLDDDVSKKTVSMNLPAVPLGTVAATASAALDVAGIEAKEKAGVWILTPRKTDDLIVYRMRHRSVSFARQLLGQAFAGVQFAEKPAAMATPSGQTGEVKQGQGSAVKSADPVTDDGEYVVFRVSSSENRAARDLLALIDTPADQLYIRAIAYDVSTDVATGSALDLAVHVLGGRLGLSITSGKLTGANTLSIKTTTVDAVAKVLDSDARFRTVSRPSVRVRSGAKARFSVGQEVPTLGGITTNNGSSTQAVVYRPSGVIFEVEPYSREGGIDVNIKQTISGFQMTDTSALNSPTLNKRELQTELTTQTGDVVILAGLDSDDSNSGARSFFGIPVGNTSNKTSRQSLLMLEVHKLPR